MHIVILTHYSGLYGANISLLEFLSNTSIPSSAFLLVLPEPGVLEENLKKLGIKYIICYFPFNNSTSEFKLKGIWSKVRKFIFLKDLYFQVRPYSPSLFYSNSSVIYYGFLLAKIFGVKHIWHLREFGKEDYNLYHDFGFKTFRYLLKRNNLNICISECIKSYYGLTRLANSRVIYNGIASQGKISGINKKTFGPILTFGMIGVIKPYKHQFEVIKAFHVYLQSQSCNDILVVIGARSNDRYNQEINNYIAINNLHNNIKFQGHIRSRDDIYNPLDLLIHGAKHEAFGRVTAEAMSYGVVPIGYNYGGTLEIIENNLNGFLFSDFGELPLLLKRIRSNMRELVNIQHALPQNFNQQFTVEINASRLDEVIRRLLKPGKNELIGS